MHQTKWRKTGHRFHLTISGEGKLNLGEIVMCLGNRKDNIMKIKIWTYPIILVAIGLGVLFVFITSFGEENTINNESTYLQEKIETVTDIDGNVYRTVTIGKQVWMAENLKVTHYRDGTLIPNVYDNDRWPHAKNGAYCMVDNDSTEYKDTYGLLYNFYAVNNSRGLSPEGMHVPTAIEWRKLIEYLGGNDVAGGKMKDISSNLWKIPTPGSSNESGFSGLPAGGRGRLGSAGDVGYYATWWSSTSYDSIYAWHWGLYSDKNNIRFNPGHKASGFSVRCVKDQ